MAKTSNSASTPYAEPADYVARIDVRLTGDLVRDDGTMASETDLLTDTKLAAALAGASGYVEGVLLAAERYAAADLQALTGNSLEWLKQIVCGLTIQFLRERRGISEESEFPAYVRAKKDLEGLRDGTLIFAFAETETAGLPQVSRMQPGEFFADTPSLLTNQTRFWGLLSNRRYPGGTGGF